MSKSKHVKVVVRTRPTADIAEHMVQFSPDRKAVHVHIPKSAEGGFINNQQEDWDFRFDSVLHNASQEAVYDECASSILKGLMEGYNGTIMAYGQTGGGKTFSMTGASENYKHRGLIPRAISQVFRDISDRPQYSYTARISYIEIYNEQMIDLLGPVPDVKSGETVLNVVEDQNGTAQVKGLNVRIANTEEEALSYLFEGETTRSIAEHQLNRNSSRSHCIFTIWLESRSRVESSERVLYSKLNLVDLAGSERLSKTHTTGLSLREAMYINKSLTFLEQVIIALADKRRGHIPYRQSKLTNVLRDALGGNCNTLMIANIRCEQEYVEETISTLRFATRMMCVTNTPELNVQYDPIALIKKYEREIRELKQELSMHDTLSNRGHVQHEPYTEPQKLELQKQVKVFLENEEEEMEIVSLRQVKEIFHQMRILYKMQEQENEDWHRIHKNAAGPAAGTKDDTTAGGIPGIRIPDEKDDGVGELEGSSFGVGLAPSMSRGAGGLTAAAGSIRGAKDKGRKGRPPAPQSIVSLARSEIDEDETRSELYGERDRIRAFSAHGDAQQSEAGGLPPLPNAAHSSRVQAPPPSRAEEYEAFKRGRGSDMNRIFNENKAILKDKRKNARELAKYVNDLQAQIDVLRRNVEQKRQSRSAGDVQSGDDIIIDEEEYVFLNNLKQLKQDYRTQFDNLRALRADIGYCHQLVEQCRQKLLMEFEQWYENQFGGQVPDDGHDGQVEDILDIGEKFDRLQMARMSQEDPDSLPFYNARKNTIRKHQRAGPKIKRVNI
ncbi:P-loop containing nucleoside triphosphate hydrolase protein [Fimicolochytrium jonesii]|uniref:P-loop containing nucleoside triphosphate hydrolase protein n=1 Tax=Fimicolochytrium jonesii TaxID=1396493 RepID=UPI0022FE3B22|nr:P-loop containing nucleoside triphosphate hydrolase protein [Fimicolochytrium jonesii]KAI8822057.1 P-loop containing nucleoside triphosphate hydrolase protein [Fimicolochytrium jonesii]